MRHLAIGFVFCFVVSCLMGLPAAARAEVSFVSVGVGDDATASNEAKDKKAARKKAKKKASDEAAKEEKEKERKDEKKADDKACDKQAEAAKDATKEGDAKKDAEKKADEKKDAAAKTQPAKPAAPKPPVHEVEAGPFQVTVELKGVFEAREMADVSIEAKQWSQFSVLKAVEHGKQVKQGDLLIAFDPEKIDRAIDELRRQVKLSDIAMRNLKEQLDAQEKLVPMDLQAIDRRQRIAKEDYDQAMKVDVPLVKESAAFSLKSSKESLAYAKEELEQLEKMYKADDLTDETEEIILRRARFQVAMGEFSVKLAERRFEESMKFSLPRQLESLEDSMTRTTLSNEKSKILLPLTLTKSKLEWEKAQIEREDLDKRLKELLADRRLMTVKSPADGIVYYGECVKGRWTGTTSDTSFRPEATVPTKKVIMTVLKTRPLIIRSAVAENEIRQVREGLKGCVKPTAFPDVRFEAVVAEVAAVPDAGNQFPVKLMVTGGVTVNVMPGMTCSTKLVAHEREDALTIPPTALGTDPLDETKHFVHLVDKDGKSEKHPVKIGERTPKAIETLEGLSAGDKVLLTCPNDAGKKKAEQKPESKAEQKPEEQKPEEKK
ncbi:MAG: HlyD family efflux transporter periplasmic adaptor subunit [Pirellulaceae bacterium]|nr:HlyD family efflux transporter periplasmic adaptor subunit [Pirellulaceae bacterium]